ncbi:MAG TPA: RNA 2'-phosphotransferase [Acidimicrobiales bacterium]|nr:RNA 2'-phosphotransferase [Acidimicrobiales bacterium]
MDQARLVKVSKYLAKHLRHQPWRIGLDLDGGGWADIGQLLERCAANNFPLAREEIEEVVAHNDKSRYEVLGDRIRARQGHSLPVALGLEATEPPEVLYHGTALFNVDLLLVDGLRPMTRQHVHLSPDVPTALRVGRRHGPPAVLQVAALAWHRAGGIFWLSTNGVWLAQAVPASYLSRLALNGLRAQKSAEPRSLRQSASRDVASVPNPRPMTPDPWTPDP